MLRPRCAQVPCQTNLDFFFISNGFGIHPLGPHSYRMGESADDVIMTAPHVTSASSNAATHPDGRHHAWVAQMSHVERRTGSTPLAFAEKFKVSTHVIYMKE